MIYELLTYLLGDAIYSFDGTENTIVDLTTSLKCVQGNNPRSISFMIQTTSTSPSVILSTGSYVTYGAFGLSFNWGGGDGIIGIESNGGYYNPATGKVMNDGLWHTVLVTYDGTTIYIYIDGRLDNTATNWNSGSTATISSTLNTIGNTGNYLGQMMDGTEKWIGQLKNICFYDYVVSNTYSLVNSYQLAGSVIYTSGINYN